MILRKKNTIAGLAVFAISLFLILISPDPFFFPQQEEEIRGSEEFGALFAKLAFIQELHAKQDYLKGVELLLGNWKRSPVKCEYILLVIDSSNNILYREKFLNSDIGLPKYYLFRFHKNILIGMGKSFYLCLYSPDATPDNNLALARNTAGKLGKLYVNGIVSNDVLASAANKGNVFGGSFCVRTYESERAGLPGFKLFLILLAILLTGSVIYHEKVLSLLLKMRIRPEWVFLVLAILAGTAMTFITPPFQVPDERNHFYRCWQLTGFNFFNHEEPVPQSLVRVANGLSGIGYVTYYKTSLKEIRELGSIGLEPDKREVISTPPYIIPYIPQALGMAAGRVLNASPLALLYYGRMANLLISVFLIFLAIRTTPVLKWVFFLLGLMPMMLFQLASVSYDATTDSLSLLLTAQILNCALRPDKKIDRKDIFLLFLLSFLLALCKPPYYMLAGMFLAIPYRRFGSLLRFALTFLLLMAVIYTGTRLLTYHGSHWPDHPPATAVSIPSTAGPVTPAAAPAAAGPAATGNQDQPSGFDATAQLKFILHNPLQYGNILLNTLRSAWKVYLDYFFGVLGWADTPLPGYLRTLYLLILLVTSLLFAEAGIRIDWYLKVYFFLLFITGIILIETGLYLYSNPVGFHIVQAVQGRYFIVFAPLFFLAFYNTHINDRMIRLLCEVMLTGLVVYTILVTLYTLLSRYYIM